MITTDADHNRVEMRAYGHLTLADLKAFEGISESRLLEAGKLDLLIDLRSLGTSTLDALVEELRFARKHATDFRRIAIVSDNELLNWGACIPGLFVEAEVCAFDNEPSARVWLDELGPLTDNAS
ncbi:MAG: hypothetical protein RJA63_2042 [Pseudomonadota bacterium]